MCFFIFDYPAKTQRGKEKKRKERKEKQFFILLCKMKNSGNSLLLIR